MFSCRISMWNLCMHKYCTVSAHSAKLRKIVFLGLDFSRVPWNFYLRPPASTILTLDWLDETDGASAATTSERETHTSFSVSSPPTSPLAPSFVFLSSFFSFIIVFFLVNSVATLYTHFFENMSFLIQLACTAALTSYFAAAQTFTSCNPLNSTNCPLDTALGTNHTWDFTTGQADTASWNTTDGTINYGTNGAEFTISKKGDAPTMQTNFYVFGGEIETWLKAAPGQGMSRSSILHHECMINTYLRVRCRQLQRSSIRRFG